MQVNMSFVQNIFLKYFSEFFCFWKCNEAVMIFQNSYGKHKDCYEPSMLKL